MNARTSAFDRLIAFALVLPLTAAAHGQTLTMDNVTTDMTNMGYPDASAELTYSLANGATDVEINVSNAAPDEFFSIWMLLDGESPLTGLPVVPLASVSDIESLAMSTPDDALTSTAKSLGLEGDDGSGSTSGPNGFFTDANGDATFFITLDYPLVDGGAFPFDEFHPSLSPAPLGSSPFLLNTLLHTDGLGYGLFPDGGPGTANPWFWTSQFAVPEPGTALLLGISCVGAAARRRWNPRRASP